MTTIDIYRAAWNSSKKPHQPPYDDLIESYRDMLTARAEAVAVTGVVDDGPLAGFDRAVLDGPLQPATSSDVGYEQVGDVEPITVDNSVTPALLEETLEQVETSRLGRAKRREEAQPAPKKTPKKAATKKPPAPKK